MASVDIVIHCAATVAFDAPVDDAFETNLLGPLRLLDALEAAGAKPQRIIHVSTAYVAGLVKGHVPEAPWTDTPGRRGWIGGPSLPPPANPGRRSKPSRELPSALAEFAKKARRDIGPAGAPAIAAQGEQLRRDWVSERLVEMGRGRAQVSRLARRLLVHQSARGDGRPGAFGIS